MFSRWQRRRLRRNLGRTLEGIGQSVSIAIARLKRLIAEDLTIYSRLRAGLAEQEQFRIEEYARIVVRLTERERVAAVERLRDAHDVGGVR